MKLAVLNGLGDPGELLIDDAAGADIGVPDFGVAHLPLRQSDVHAGGADQSMRALGQNFAEIRHSRGADGVAVCRGIVAKAVKNH